MLPFGEVCSGRSSYKYDEDMYIGVLQKRFGPNALSLNDLATKMFHVVDGGDIVDGGGDIVDGGGDPVDGGRLVFEGCGKGTKLKDKTLLVESTCSDGICREATAAMEGRWGGAYRIGGLSGFPFGGKSAIKEVAKQAPEGGDVFLMYAPHVGLSSFCEVGRLERPGNDNGELRCCESNLAAVSQVNKELRRNMLKKGKVRGWGGGGSVWER
jgi:hypothetical protein